MCVIAHRERRIIVKSLFSNGAKHSKYSSYNTKTLVPHYTPSKEMPHIDSLIDIEKYGKLIRDINASSVSDEEKRFLKFAAARHIVFHYNYIADYYAGATPEMQRLMEQSALVILDINDAIANGYVKLSKDIRKILEESGEIAGDEE